MYTKRCSFVYIYFLYLHLIQSSEHIHDIKYTQKDLYILAGGSLEPKDKAIRDDLILSKSDIWTSDREDGIFDGIPRYPDPNVCVIFKICCFDFGLNLNMVQKKYRMKWNLF